MPFDATFDGLGDYVRNTIVPEITGKRMGEMSADEQNLADSITVAVVDDPFVRTAWAAYDATRSFRDQGDNVFAGGSSDEIIDAEDNLREAFEDVASEEFHDVAKEYGKDEWY